MLGIGVPAPVSTTATGKPVIGNSLQLVKTRGAVCLNSGLRRLVPAVGTTYVGLELLPVSVCVCVVNEHPPGQKILLAFADCKENRAKYFPLMT